MDCKIMNLKASEFYMRARTIDSPIELSQVYKEFARQCITKEELNELDNTYEGMLNEIKSKLEVSPIQDTGVFFEIKNLDYAAFAKYLVEKYSFINIDDAIFIKDNDVYRYAKDTDIEFAIMDNIYNSTIKNRKEIVAYIRRYAPKKEEADKRYILFNNGIFDIKSKEFVSLNEDTVFFNKINCNYNPEAKPVKIVDDFFSSISCYDEQIKTLLLQMIAYCFYRDNPISKFFILKGVGANGKSTLFKIMKELFGKSNVSDLELSGFSDKYGVGIIRNKLVNLGDDIDDTYIERCATVKKAVSGETITVEEKYQPKFTMRYKGKLIFSANNMPKMSDKSNGMKRRLIVIPMLANYDPNNGGIKGDPYMDEKVTTKEALEYIAKICMEQLEVILRENSFSKSDLADMETAEYNRENNPLIPFLENICSSRIERCDGARLPLKYLYIKWNSYCDSNGIPNKKTIMCFKNDVITNAFKCGMGEINIERRKASTKESELFRTYGIVSKDNEYYIMDYFLKEDEEIKLSQY